MDGSPRPEGPDNVLRWVARIWAEVAIVGYLLWQATTPSPVAGEGDYWERLASLALIVVIAIGHVVSWRWEIQGATVMAVAGALLALTTLFRVEAFEAALTAEQARRGVLITLAVFSTPAVLYWLIWRRSRSRRQVVSLAVLLVVLVAGTSTAAMAIFSTAYGSRHPASTVAQPQTSPVVWVWAGPPTDESAVVVTRVEDPSAQVELAVGTDPRLVGADRVPAASRAIDDPGVVRFEVERLAPATRYHYAVVVGDTVVEQRAGSLRTAPAEPAGVRFAVGSCILTGSNGSVFDQIRAQRPDLFLITGDFAYRDFWTEDRAEVRRMYNTQLTSPAIDALVREVPVAYVWDDHDFGPNDADSTAASGPAAQIVYRQDVPYQALPAGPGPEPIYQSFSYGGVRFVLTDGRSQRSPKGDPDDANKTMLGSRQQQWLAEELRTAAAEGQFVVLVTNVPWNGEAQPGADDWAGYSTERREVADLIAGAGVADQLLMVAGDAHMLAIDNGSHTDFSTGGSGGFPLLQAAALDQRGSFKAGPYSEGSHPGGGQFALVEISPRDPADGGLTVSISGLDYSGTELLGYTFEVPAAAFASG